jgi:hypothetical protein
VSISAPRARPFPHNHGLHPFRFVSPSLPFLSPTGRRPAMRTRSGSLYSRAGESAAAVGVGQKRKRSSAWFGQSPVAAECSGGRRKRLAGGPDYLDELPDDLVLSILSKVAVSASAPSDLLSVHLAYVTVPPRPGSSSSSIRRVWQAQRSPSCFNGLQTLVPHECVGGGPGLFS